MTWPRYEAMCAGWQRVPPVSVSAYMIAIGLGAAKAAPAPQQKAAAKPDQENDRQALFEMLGGAGFATKKPDWLTNG